MDIDNLVSIIIPIYNAQAYLDRCIQSVINQTYSNLQIILVNDGSLDRSLDICNKFEILDSRVKVISTNNNGVSRARNIGIEFACGKYLCFVDSDDYIGKTMVQELLNNMKTYNVQLSICGFREGTLNYLKNMTYGKLEVYDREKGLQQALAEDSYRGFLCNKMFNRFIIEKYKIRLSEELYVWEDVEFVTEYILKVDRIVYMPLPLYNYIYRENSTSHETSMEKALNVIKAQELIEQKLKNCRTEVKSELSHRILHSVVDAYRVACMNGKQYKKYVSQLKSIAKGHMVQGKLLLSVKEKIILFICIHFPSLFKLLYLHTHKNKI